jgi:hypothetical protein
MRRPRSILRQASRIYKSLGNDKEEARVMVRLAMVRHRQGHQDEALQLFQRSMERAGVVKLVDLQIEAGEGLGLVLTAKRDFFKCVAGDQPESRARAQSRR